MLSEVINLIILFFVIFDPLMSLPIFLSATRTMTKRERMKVASTAITVAITVSFLVIVLGLKLLEWFSTTFDDFKIAGGIILGILGIQMVLGKAISEPHEGEKEAKASAVIIGSPLLTGPAAITTIMITVTDYGMLTTAISVGTVLVLTGLFLYEASRITKFLGKTTIKVMSTMMGLITLSWGVMFVRSGLGI